MFIRCQHRNKLKEAPERYLLFVHVYFSHIKLSVRVYWGRYLIDAIFRNGKAHSNHGNHVYRVVTDIVKTIRTRYRSDIPIIFLADTGFFDETLFELCEKLNIGFIVGGKIYNDIKNYVNALPDEQFAEFTKGKNAWVYCEFANKRKSWNHYWRTIYAKPVKEEDGQFLMEFARPETIIYTNLGMTNKVTRAVLKLQQEEASEIDCQAIINAYHFRALDELINRAFKNFGTEHLPFKRFAANAAFYYMMAISFFLFESFMYDLHGDTVSIKWYASTFRRRLLDFAGKLVSGGKRITLKITQSTRDELNFPDLWQRSVEAPGIPLPVV